MAIYEYACPNGHETEELRSVADRNDVRSCEDCNEVLSRKGIERKSRPRVLRGTPRFKQWVK